MRKKVSGRVQGGPDLQANYEGSLEGFSEEQALKHCRLCQFKTGRR